MKFLTTVLLAAVSLTLASESRAEIVNAKDPEVILELARILGPASLGEDASGDPKITGKVHKFDYTIMFYGCKKGRNCDDLQFAAMWDTGNVTLRDVNGWNRSKRVSKAYIDDDTLTLTMATNINYGVTKENIEDQFDWWQLVVKEFSTEFLAKHH